MDVNNLTIMELTEMQKGLNNPLLLEYLHQRKEEQVTKIAYSSLKLDGDSEAFYRASLYEKATLMAFEHLIELANRKVANTGVETPPIPQP